MNIKNKEKIRIPEHLQQIIEESNIGIKLPNNLTYNKFLGNNSSNIQKATQKYDYQPDKELYEIKLPKPPIQLANQLYGQFYNHEKVPENTQLYAMVNGATFPLKIDYTTKGFSEKTLYAKKPNTNRLIGHFLHNIISDTRIKIGYNEELFVEEEVPGTILLEENDQLLYIMPEYQKSIGKAAARSEFLGLHDVSHPRNRLINKTHETNLFDFDNIFEPTTKTSKLNPLIKLYHNQEKLTPIMIQSYREEKKEIARRIITHKNIVYEFMNAVDNLFDETYGTIKEKIKLFSGQNSSLEYIQKQTKLFAQ